MIEGPPPIEENEKENTQLSLEERVEWLRAAQEQLELAQKELEYLTELVKSEEGEELEKTKKLIAEAKELVDGLPQLIRDLNDDIHNA